MINGAKRGSNEEQVFDDFSQAQKQGSAGGTHSFHTQDPFSIFEELFRGGTSFGGFGQRKGPSIKHVLTLTLEELYKGCTKPVRVLICFTWL